MAKAKTLYVCQECGNESHKWLGRCPGCDAWNTLLEEVRAPEPAATLVKVRKGYGAEGGSAPILMKDVETGAQRRLMSGIGELDRVLGGGFVAGGVILLGGDPGIGKSTLSLQVCGLFCERKLKVLYVTGEESAGQIRMRGERLGVSVEDVLVLCETSLERVEAQVLKDRPDLLVLDSIQTLATDRLTSSPGSVAQLREVTSALTQLAKGLQIPTILVGHVTKEGSIAGPKVLEHMVDTVLYFEGESGMSHRILRVVKNRYGATNEIGVFEMRVDGLIPVPNPSAMFLAERPTGAAGSVVVPVLEGTRPLLVEIQALVSPTSYGPPRITSVGVDQNRVLLLLNIIEKRTGLQIAGQDVFVNVAGGARVSEPAADLGIAMALVSSFRDRPVGDQTVFFGEVGLTGEVRAVSQGAARLMEGYKLGFDRLIVPRGNLKAIEDYLGASKDTDFPRLRIEAVRTLAEALEAGLA
ncbi:MAG: DNA repair protein RadA [Bradymonadaceae bacterium]